VVKIETGEIAIKINATYYAGSFQTVDPPKKLNNFLGCKKDKIANGPNNKSLLSQSTHTAKKRNLTRKKSTYTDVL
jgi:hypothetical protein